MNLVELNAAIKTVRNYIKTYRISMVGDSNNIFINPKLVQFGGEIPSDYTYHVGDIGVSYVNRENAAGLLGFNIETSEVTCLNQCISGTQYYNGNHDHEDFSATPLIDTDFSGHLVLKVIWEKGDWDAGELSATLYTTPNFLELRAEAEKADELRWINDLGGVEIATRRGGGRR